MPNSNRNTQQTSTTNLGTNFVVPQDPKPNKRANKATKNPAAEVVNEIEVDDISTMEGHSLPASPSQSNESLNLGSQGTRRKDVDWINTVGNMIKTNSAKMSAEIYKKLDENAKKISKKINEVDKKQTEKLRDLERKIDDVKCDLSNLVLATRSKWNQRKGIKCREKPWGIHWEE